MRAFIACDIFCEGIGKVVDEIKKTGADVKFVEPENTHITLKFLGEVDERRALEIGRILEDVFTGAFPLEATLKEVGVFPSLDYMKVVWIGMECPVLEALQRRLDEALHGIGFKKERSFKLHLTIGRIKSHRNKNLLRKAVERLMNTVIGSYNIDSVKLKKSELTPKGPIYSNLKVVV